MVDWMEQIHSMALAAGYGDVIFGHADIEALDKNGHGFCRTKPHGEGPRIDGWPAIWVIVMKVLGDYGAASCHWTNMPRLTPEQKQVFEIDHCAHIYAPEGSSDNYRRCYCVKRFPNWVCERKGL